MEKQPVPPRLPLAPILLGAFSLFGICLVLLMARFSRPATSPPAPDTETPFKFLLIGTEPGISTVSDVEIDPESETIEGTSNPPKPGFAITAQQGVSTSSSSNNSSPGGNASNPTPTLSSSLLTAASNPSEAPVIVINPKTPSATSGVILPSKTPTRTRTPAPTPTVTPSRTKSVSPTPGTPVPTNSPTRTPTSASTAPLGPGTYDDTDARLVYSGNWIGQSGVSAFQNTLHVSNTINNPPNSVVFRFIGTEVRLFYLSGPSLGTVSISLDGLQFNLDQSDSSSQTSEWVSATLVNGTHTVVISHISGGSINLDFIVVPDVPTPTPP